MASFTHSSSVTRGLAGLLERLYRPIDPASLAFFRVGFGLVIAWEMWRYLDHDWVVRHYQEPELLFKYWLFEWVDPLPGVWLTLAFIAIGFFAFMVAIGLFYRFSAVVVFVGLWYIFLLDKARYLNHWYLMILIALLMVFIPAASAYSVDARRKGGSFTGAATIPAWPVWMLRFQVGVVYFFGGLAKLNSDWLRGEPIATWLAERQDFPIIGPLFASQAVGIALGYGALLMDLLVVFLLLHRRTRPYAFLAVLGFHLMNDGLFRIGVFPWFMIVGTMLFFDADWPRQVWADLKAPNYRGMAFVGGATAGLIIGAAFPRTFVPMQAAIFSVALGLAVHQLLPQPDAETTSAEPSNNQGGSWLAIGVMAAWVTIQVLLPLRHFVVPGNVHWTEEGHRYSWHMKLRDKESTAVFIVSDPATGESFEVDPDDFLSSRQERRVGSIPDIAVQFARYLDDDYSARTGHDVEVRVDGWASLNGREPQRLFDPNADLSEVSIPSFGADWLVPLDDTVAVHRAG